MQCRHRVFLEHADLVRHGRLRWGKIPSVRLANPPVPLAGCQARLPGRFWAPADKIGRAGRLRPFAGQVVSEVNPLGAICQDAQGIG